MDTGPHLPFSKRSIGKKAFIITLVLTFIFNTVIMQL